MKILRRSKGTEKQKSREGRLKSILKNPRKHRKTSQKYINDGTERGVNQNTLKAFFAIFVFIGIMIAVFSIFVFSSPFPIEDRQYLLSSISQGLAAVFTLVITVTLVASQMLVKYGSDQLDRILSIPVIIYLLFFIFCIVFPLFLLLNNHYNSCSVKISLILTAICLLFLFPYIYHFKEMLKPENIIECHLKRLKKKI